MSDLQSPFPSNDANWDWKKKCFNALQKLEDSNSNPVGKENIFELRKNKQEIEINVVKIQNEVDDLTKRIKEIELTNEEKSSIRPELALYELITKIVWDLESPENKLKGFVAGRSLKVFDLDVTKYSEQEIVDYLWKLIDPQSL